MDEVEILPELKEIVGAMLFGARQPVSIADIRRVLKQVAEEEGGVAKDFARAGEEDIRGAVDELKRALAACKAGVQVVEVAHGFRLVNDANCGPWLRRLLEKGKPARLSQPALETLAVIAYRQPCTRAEIEAVRGVEVDQMVRNLLELQLVRMVGRSELPGRPWMLGTTHKFMEYFGLRSLEDLPGIQELRRMEAEQMKRRAAGVGAEAVAPDERDGAEPREEAGEEAYEDDDEEEDEGSKAAAKDGGKARDGMVWEREAEDGSR